MALQRSFDGNTPPWWLLNELLRLPCKHALRHYIVRLMKNLAASRSQTPTDIEDEFQKDDPRSGSQIHTGKRRRPRDERVEDMPPNKRR